MQNDIVLKLNGLSKRFGPVVAVSDLHLSLNKGEVLALLGENGAGKTTLMNMLFGHYLPDAGTIEMADVNGALRPLALGQPQAALTAGVGMVHQHFTLAENLNAFDNITLGSEPLFALQRKRRAAVEKIKGIIKRSGLDTPLDVPVGQLSIGERQRVEILKALYRDARILVLDEPTAVLTPQEADMLFANIKSMTASGLSVIFISHKLREVMAFSDRIAVLRHGRKIGELQTQDNDESTLVKMMVGAEVPVLKRPTLPQGSLVLQLEDISAKGRSKRDTLSRANLNVYTHEIVGIAGVSGNGQRTLANLIAGLIPPASGRLRVASSEMEASSPAKMIAAGVGRIPEDRHHEGIVGTMSVAENMVLERLSDPDVQSFGLLRLEEIQSHADNLIKAYDVRGPGRTAAARLLSGGNIQKLILARVFERAPKLILANQPTRGLDMGAASDVARRLMEARQRGAGIVLISEDLDEIIGLSDRIFVIRDGVLSEATSKDRTRLGLMMTGEAA